MLQSWTQTKRPNNNNNDNNNNNNNNNNSGPLTHSQSHQAQNTVEHTEVKQSRAWTKDGTGEVIW